MNRIVVTFTAIVVLADAHPAIPSHLHMERLYWQLAEPVLWSPAVPRTVRRQERPTMQPLMDPARFRSINLSLFKR